MVVGRCVLWSMLAVIDHKGNCAVEEKKSKRTVLRCCLERIRVFVEIVKFRVLILVFMFERTLDDTVDMAVFSEIVSEPIYPSEQGKCLYEVLALRKN